MHMQGSMVGVWCSDDVFVFVRVVCVLVCMFLCVYICGVYVCDVCMLCTVVCVCVVCMHVCSVYMYLALHAVHELQMLHSQTL